MIGGFPFPPPYSGGWAYTTINNDTGERQAAYGSVQDTNNNRMELLAALKAVQALPRSTAVLIFSDSSYVSQGVNFRAKAWRSRQWTNSKGKPVQDRDLWEAMLVQIERHQRLHVVLIKSHSGRAENNHCDRLARYAAHNKLNSVAS